MTSHPRCEKKMYKFKLNSRISQDCTKLAGNGSVIRQCLDGDWLGCLGRKTIGKECGAW